MFNELFEDDVYDINPATASRWMIHGEYGIGYRVKDTVLDRDLKAFFLNLDDAYELLQILSRYEETGKYNG